MGRWRYLRTIGPGEMSWERVGEAIARRATDVPHRLRWSLSGEGRGAAQRLEGFRDVHRGERCVLVANGPSLRHTPLDLVRGERIIGLNRVHLLDEQFRLRPDYAVVSDILCQLQHLGDALGSVPMPKFVNWNGRHLVSGDDFHFFKTSFRPRFSRDFASTIYGGHSVTYAALQLAYFMGFQEVVLIGKDHSYAVSGSPKEQIVSDGSEDNHFSQGYYEPGQIWRIPDYKGEEMAYEMARVAFEADGRRVIDATVGGRLDIFPKVELETVLG